MAILVRHRNHYLRWLTQTYLAIPKTLARQDNEIYVWCPNDWVDLQMIHMEINVLTDDDKLVIVGCFLKTSKHACLYIRNEHHRGLEVVNHVWVTRWWLLSEPVDSFKVIVSCSQIIPKVYYSRFCSLLLLFV